MITRLEEELHRFRRLRQRGQVQRRLASRVPRVHVGASAQQMRGRFGIAVLAGQVKRRHLHRAHQHLRGEGGGRRIGANRLRGYTKSGRLDRELKWIRCQGCVSDDLWPFLPFLCSCGIHTLGLIASAGLSKAFTYIGEKAKVNGNLLTASDE